MKQAICKLTSTSPYGQSRFYGDEETKQQGENHKDYEERTWRNRLHVVPETGHVFIPAGAFSNAIKYAGKRLGIQIPGRGKRNYTKAFEAGVMVQDDLVLPVLAQDINCVKLFVPSNGVAGDGKRVTKYFPRIPSWSGEVVFLIGDDELCAPHGLETFQKALEYAGKLVGIGFYRPEKRGTWGRFQVDSIKFEAI